MLYSAQKQLQHSSLLRKSINYGQKSFTTSPPGCSRSCPRTSGRRGTSTCRPRFEPRSWSCRGTRRR